MRSSRLVVLLSLCGLGLYVANDVLQRAIAQHANLGPELLFGLYSIVTAALFLLYFQVLRLCKLGRIAPGLPRYLALAAPCVFNILLVFRLPSLSQDEFSYIAHGILGLAGAGNPLTQAADQVATTGVGALLAGYGWHGPVGITPYGIVWTQIEVAAAWLGGNDIAFAVILLKSVVAAASLATALCIWGILGRARPSLQLYGTLAYLWNPLLVIEFAGEGHNDAVMVFFVIAALLACAAQWRTTSLALQLLGFFSKYVPALFVPVQVAYLWRTRRNGARFALEMLGALIVSLVIASLLYAPLWAGWHSFDGIVNRAQPISSASPFGVINWILRRSALAPMAGKITTLAVTLPLVCLIGWASLRVKDVAGLARAFAWIAVGYLLVCSPDYWPWYACMPVALLILADCAELSWLIFLLSFGARLCAPLEVLRGQGYLSNPLSKGMLTGIGVTLPLAALLVWWCWGWRRQRMAASVA